MVFRRQPGRQLIECFSIHSFEIFFFTLCQGKTREGLLRVCQEHVSKIGIQQSFADHVFNRILGHDTLYTKIEVFGDFYFPFLSSFYCAAGD